MNTWNQRLPLKIKALVDSELLENERVIWCEQPIPARLARSTLPVFFFALVWTGFAIFWTGSAASFPSMGPEMGLARAFPFFGVPFILIGVGMLLAPVWAWGRAKRTVYFITDHRAVIVVAGWWNRVQVRSFEPDQLTRLRREQGSDGSGDLIFAEEIQRDNEGNTQSTDVGFLGIRNVKLVQEIVHSLVLDAQAHALP